MADVALLIPGPRRARSTYRSPASGARARSVAVEAAPAVDADPSEHRAQAPAFPVEWRQLHRRLWVARANGEHLGTIERGRRFTVTDRDNAVRGRYATLHEAQAVLARSSSHLD